MKPNDPRDAAAAGARRHATVLESVEEIRALVRHAGTLREDLPSTVSIEPTPDAAELFRPVERPSMAVLTVIDDGDESGEPVRLRASTFLIGRIEGDLVIPHDG